jgi:hypothetical protein
VLNSSRVYRNLSGPHLHSGAPVAQLDRAFGYEPFEGLYLSIAHHN